MNRQEYERKTKEDKPVIAICYDFDKTLSPDDMQAQGYIQAVGYEETNEFWNKSNALAKMNGMDQNLAYMFTMMEEAEGKLVFTRKNLREYGANVKLFPGVKDWFDRIRRYGEEKGVIVEHYIISSGLKEMIEGTAVADEFERIYASSFLFNEKDVAKWPAQAVNYTNKTQFLFRIEKGVLDVNDPAVNDYFEPDKIRVPFRNMVYIGDSETDIPCMKLVNSSGGHSIGVYNPETQVKAKVYKMMREGRIRYFVPADYNDGSDLDKLVKAIIDRTATNEVLETKYHECRNEYIKADKESSEEEKTKVALIIDLESSNSFSDTHTVINKLSKYSEWSDEQKEWLCDIGAHNSQVFRILKDEDVKRFYKKAIGKYKSDSNSVQLVRDEIS